MNQALYAHMNNKRKKKRKTYLEKNIYISPNICFLSINWVDTTHLQIIKYFKKFFKSPLKNSKMAARGRKQKASLL
jgi:hypothetical protein